jgi:NAD(P)-dependent dehydrogenase (short-subunit alcohol dehydrogenase family)
MSLVCVVTGCSEPQGFGWLFAEELRRRGHVTIATMRDIAGRHRDAARDLGRTVEVLELDVTDDAGAQALISKVIARHGHIDALVNNAANVRHGALEDTSVEALGAGDEGLGEWVGGMEEPANVAGVIADAIEDPDTPLHVPVGDAAVQRRAGARAKSDAELRGQALEGIDC